MRLASLLTISGSVFLKDTNVRFRDYAYKTHCHCPGGFIEK